VPLRSIAVLGTRSRPVTWKMVARDYYKVGILEVEIFETRSYCTEIVKPPEGEGFYRVKEYIKQLTELHKTFALAGSSKGGHLTDYKLSMIEVKEFVSNNPGCTVREVVDELGALHYAHENSAKANLISTLEFVEDWCTVDRSTRPPRLFMK